MTEEPESSSEEAPRKRMRPWMFVVRFLVLLAVLYFPLTIPKVDERLIAPFTRGIAQVSAATLHLVGERAEVHGTLLTNGKTTVGIQNGCNGVEATIFLVAAVAAFPASWKHRLLGITFGIVLIQALNLVRVVSLFLIECYHPDLFEMFHIAIWQTLIGGATIGFFYAWTLRAAASLAPAHRQ